MKRYQDNKERQLIQALLTLRQRCRVEFNTLVEWLTDSRREQQDANDELIGVDLSKGQGYSRCLREIVQEIESAPESMAKLQAAAADTGSQADG